MGLPGGDLPDSRGDHRLDFYSCQEINDLPGINYGFIGRKGGYSTGRYASLNLSYRVGDEPEAVTENHELLQEKLGRPLCLVKQVHSDRVLTVKDSNYTNISHEEADALITDLTEIPLAVLTADCLPVLLIDPVKRVAGAVHAGLKGTLSRICAKTVKHLIEEYKIDPLNLYALIGPGIGGCCYEIEKSRLTENQRNRFLSCCHKGETPGKIFFNLRKANLQQLRGMGVKKIYHLDYCTCCHNDKFFSYRADGGLTGRFASFVMLKNQ